jgi:prepilin-type N-terminal cleavage/methylation domain-containing protein
MQVRTQKGFTLIELVMIIVILGILAAIVIPKYVDLSTQATNSAKSASQSGTKAAWAIYIGQNNGAFPTVTQVAAGTDGGTAVATGIQFTISGTNYTVQTYTNAACTTATAAVGDSVKCVGAVTP